MSVNCILEPVEDPNKIEVIQIDGRLLVLDENDNVMVTQEDFLSNVTVFISFSDHDYKIQPVSIERKEKKIARFFSKQNVIMTFIDTWKISNCSFIQFNSKG